jgi:hypothetical protein
VKQARPIGRVAGVFAATGSPSSPHAFVTQAVEALAFDTAGIRGDLHAGLTRRSGPREPWLPRGLTLRNDRQVSALCPAELAAIARGLDLPALPPEWLGGNLLVEGLVALSAIGGGWGGTGRFDGSAVLRVEAHNLPCRRAGGAVAAATGRSELAARFVKAAAGLRGLVLSVDLPGTIAVGDAVVVIPPVTVKGATR